MDEADRSDSDGEEKIPVGISSCLLGEEVRYNGGHKLDRYIRQVLGQYFKFIPVCPEVAIGLGVPRPPIRLVGDPDAPRAVDVTDPDRDVTEDLAAHGRRMAGELSGISAYLFKSRSPSCGMERVKVYGDKGAPAGKGQGIYAREIMRANPLLPVEEEGRLNDPLLRDNFLLRVHVYDRWRRMIARGVTPGALVEFHSRNKFLILAHDQQRYRRLGRIVANAGGGDIEAVAADYISLLMEALRKPASRRNQANALMHLAGYFKKLLDSGDRQELADSIEAYRRGERPLLVPLTLLRHHLRRHPDAYVEAQRYLEPFPRELGGIDR